VNVNIADFPEDLHHRAKIQAAIEKTSLKGLIIKALTEYLERAKKKGG
jgi:predicted HicB family RNase H-like nuclease